MRMMKALLYLILGMSGLIPPVFANQDCNLLDLASQAYPDPVNVFEVIRVMRQGNSAVEVPEKFATHAYLTLYLDELTVPRIVSLIGSSTQDPAIVGAGVHVLHLVKSADAEVALVKLLSNQDVYTAQQAGKYLAVALSRDNLKNFGTVDSVFAEFMKRRIELKSAPGAEQLLALRKRLVVILQCIGAMHQSVDVSKMATVSDLYQDLSAPADVRSWAGKVLQGYQSDSVNLKWGIDPSGQVVPIGGL